MAVNEVLENIGGKWDRKAKGHTFEADPTEKLDEVLLTGETINEKQLYQFYETPKIVADRVIELADIKAGMTVLEPEAGRGALADVVPKDVELTCVELDPAHVPVLREKGYDTLNTDFLTTSTASKFDRIVMNPPFTKQQDIDHVLHAYEMLNDDGRLVAIMSPGFTFRENKKSRSFRDLVNLCGSWEELPAGAFKESGTMVRTVIVVLKK